MNNLYEIGDKVILECKVCGIKQLANGKVLYKLKAKADTELTQHICFGEHSEFFDEFIITKGGDTK